LSLHPYFPKLRWQRQEHQEHVSNIWHFFDILKSWFSLLHGKECMGLNELNAKYIHSSKMQSLVPPSIILVAFVECFFL
jgi:succinate dehydrogenase hydrophobic anchor subunit